MNIHYVRKTKRHIDLKGLPLPHCKFYDYTTWDYTTADSGQFQFCINLMQIM